LGHHPHVHALVPGGGPSLSDDRWIETRHPRQHRRRKPYLINNELLSERFRELFIAGVERLQCRGELQVDDALALDSQLSTLRTSPWVVYTEAPPHADASPEHVLRYLARYMTGGPISDKRLVCQMGDNVAFLARSHEKQLDSSPPRQVPVTSIRLTVVSMSGAEFVRCWSLHILPKGYTKVRRYGGFSNHHCRSYLPQCRELLHDPTDDLPLALTASEPNDVAEATSSCCPTCRQPLICLAETPRPGWDLIMSSHHRPPWYTPIKPRAG
jgi:hypothetical protein